MAATRSSTTTSWRTRTDLPRPEQAGPLEGDVLIRDRGPVDPETGLTAGETAELVDLLHKVSQAEQDSVIDHEPDPVRTDSVRVERPAIAAKKAAAAKKTAAAKKAEPPAKAARAAKAAAKKVPAVPAEAAKAVKAAGANRRRKPAEE